MTGLDSLLLVAGAVLGVIADELLILDARVRLRVGTVRRRARAVWS